jgi:hypothetical protein
MTPRLNSTPTLTRATATQEALSRNNLQEITARPLPITREETTFRHHAFEGEESGHTSTEATDSEDEDDPPGLQKIQKTVTFSEDTNNTANSPTHRHNTRPLTLAATSATAEEEELAKKGRHPDGSRSVEVPKRVWRPRISAVYEEPEDILDTSGDLDWLFNDNGKAIIENKAILTPRDDLIKYRPDQHEKEIKENIQWRDCPKDMQPIIMELIKKYYDVFAPEGMQNPIRGFEFNIDTGKAVPLCCKPPRYGPHEQRVIDKLATQLETKGIIEDDDGPWGSQIVLASKPNQGHVHWSQYVFRLCVSYRSLNGITRPFTFPIKRCDDAVDCVGRAEKFLTLDFDAGYWQVYMNKSSRQKTAFFTPDGKKRFTVMPMGATNAHPAFVAMVTRFEILWNKRYKEQAGSQNGTNWTWLRGRLESQLKNMHADGADAESTTHLQEAVSEARELLYKKEAPASTPGSAVIVDDVILFASSPLQLLFYFTCVLEVLQHHRVTVKLKKTRFLPTRAEFVGVDILRDGNTPAQAKNDAIRSLTTPQLFGDLSMLIGFIGFYRKWIPNYEDRIGPWRQIMKHRPTPGELDREAQATLLRLHWRSTDEELLNELKDEILAGPVLKRPDSNRRFYLKSDWSAHAQGAVLLQAGCTKEEEEAIQREINGERCEFEKTIGGLRLRPIAFISQRREEPSSRHSFVGEAATGRWAMLKFKHWLIGCEFTWITDCSGLLKFFEADYEATHTIQRWKLELLRFDFTIVHRPARMLTECDMLSRYNTWVSKWKETKKEPDDNADDETQNQGTTLHSFPTQQEEQYGVTNYQRWAHGHKKEPPSLFTDIKQFATQVSVATPLPQSHINPVITGPKSNERTPLAEACDKARTMWIIGQGAETATAAMEQLGIHPLILRTSEEDNFWQEQCDAPNLTTFLSRLMRNQQDRPEWILVPRAQEYAHGSQRDNLETMLRKARGLEARAAIMIWTTSHEDHEEQRHNISRICEDNRWNTKIGKIANAEHGGYLDSAATYLIAAAPEVISAIGTHEFKPHEDPSALKDILDDDDDGTFTDSFIWSQQTADDCKTKATTHGSKISTIIKATTRDGKKHRVPVFNNNRPGPTLQDRTTAVGTKAFVVEATDGITAHTARPIRNHELLAAMGYPPTTTQTLAAEDTWEQVYQRLTNTAPRHILEPLIACLWTAETQESEQRLEQQWSETNDQEDIDEIQRFEQGTYGTAERSKCLLTRIVNRWTTLPIPTTQTWKEATNQDPDLTLIKAALEANHDLSKSRLDNKAYHKEWTEGKLELKEGVLYQLEVPKATRIRQLQRRVVPRSLRPTILAAYHATPLAGHTGFYKTYWRIAARYWWPGMSKDIREAVINCGHCRVANSTSHEAQQIIGALSTDEPFDIISMDIWHPGKTKTDSKYHNVQKATLTCLCNTTGFASTAFVNQIDSDQITRLAFSHFFVPNGLPKLVIVDEGSEFKGVLVTVCETLGIQYYVAPPESHNAVLCERFHRYLNKVLRIGVADQQTYEQWTVNTLFATYAWNASPVDGTDVIRSFAAKARTFKFPLDIQTDQEVARIPQQGEAAIQHVETMFPLWFQQKELLKTLNEERRARHREMANKDKKHRRFQPGDLVLVRKQVTSNASEGKPAKLTLKARGPYRVLEAAGDHSYWVQKIPAIQAIQKKKGKRHKELAMRMEKLPSSVVIHKRVDTLDTRLAQMEGQLANNPLERNLGFFDFGKYTTAAEHEDFAFVKINEMWNEPIEAVLDSESDYETDEDEPNDKAIPEEAKNEEETQDNDNTNKKQQRAERLETQTRKHRKRKRDIDTTTQTPETRAATTNIDTTKQYVSQLWKDIANSTDRLFFICRHEEGRPRAEWHLAQVDLDETNQRAAKTQGTYHVRYYIRHHIQSKTRVTRLCRYWPLIREIRPDGHFGDIIMIQPDRVEKHLAKKPLTRGWYQMEANIAENGIVGPFDFTRIDGESHRIAPHHWMALLEKGTELNIDTRDINKVIPLG